MNWFWNLFRRRPDPTNDLIRYALGDGPLPNIAVEAAAKSEDAANMLRQLTGYRNATPEARQAIPWVTILTLIKLVVDIVQKLYDEGVLK